jgi:putative hydrolase of the HAD superfamily
VERTLNSVEAVTFDVGGTLIEPWPSVGHVYAQVAARFGYKDISPRLLNQQFKTAWGALKDFRHTPEQWSALVDETFRGLVEPLPSNSFFPALFVKFSEPDAWRIFDDVLPTLLALKARGIKLGIVSNWDDRLRPLLQQLKLDCYFQTIVVSCEVGAPKPDRLMFDTARAGLGSQAGNTLHVGDSLAMDFEGARAAGLQARLLRRGVRRSAGRITSLSELNKI